LPAGRLARLGATPDFHGLSTRLAAIAVAAFVCATMACSHDTTTSPSPTVTRTTDTFSGTVSVGGSAYHTFSVAQTGTVDLTLTAAAPPSTILMGIGIGMVSDSACVVMAGASGQAQAGASPQLSGTVSPGTLCAEINDVGNQAAPVTYTLTVTHP
jgi:hypothetical protein